MPTVLNNQPSPKLDSPTNATNVRRTDGAIQQSPQQEKPRRNEIHLTDQTNLLPFKKVLASFLCLSLCIVVGTLDSVTVATALPTISTAFNAGSVVSWVPSAYLLTSTSFQPLYGRFSDIFGRKVMLTVAMLIFMIGNLAAGFSKSIVQIIVFRGIAGAGGGAILSMAQIIVSDIVTLRDRGKYQGIIGGVVTIGYTIGPIIGGALSQKVTWRWCFWINLPVSLAAIAVVNFILPFKPVQGDIRRKLLVVDYVGSSLTLIACTLIILPLIWGGVTFPWDSAVVLAPLICGLFTCALFVLWEWKGAKLPIVPMRIFKHATVCGVYITMFINGLITFSLMFYLPQFFQVVLKYGPIHAGLFLIPVLVSQMVVSWIAGIVVSKTGRYRTIVHSGFALWSLACGLISTITPQTRTGVMVVFMLLSGIGSGQTLQTTTVAAQASVPRRDMSVVTAFRNFVRMLGGTLALAVGATLINNTLRTSMKALSLPEEIIKKVIDDPSILSHPASTNLSADQAIEILNRGYTKGFRLVFIMNASLSAVATVTSVLLIKHKELTREDDEMLKNSAKRRVKDSQGDPEKGSEENRDSESDVGNKSGLSEQSPETTVNGHLDTREPVSSPPSIAASEALPDHKEKDGGRNQ